MDIAIIGPGKMNRAMPQRLILGGQRVAGLYQSTEIARKPVVEHRLTAAFSTAEAVAVMCEG